MIVAGASAYALVIDWARFRKIADDVGAYLFVDMAPLRRAGGRRRVPQPGARTPISSPPPPTKPCAARVAVILAQAEFEKQLNSAVFPAQQGGPLMHVIAAKAAFKGSRRAGLQGIPPSRWWPMRG